ncbi:hypothetical protein EG829_31905, partial [bacterium]|nr:hypothetical protein [bacterium]
MHSRLARSVLAALLCAALVPIGGGAAFAERSIDTEFPVSLADNGQVQPAIDYPFLVYKNETVYNEEESTDIWGYNLETGESFPICLAAGEQANPSVSDGRVVYSDDRENNPDGCNIYLYDLNTGEESVIASNTEAEGNPFILGDRVLFNHWETDGDTGGDIHMVDLATGVESTVCADAGNQREPTMWGEYAAWRDESSGSDVALHNFVSGVTTTIADASVAPNLYYYDPMIGDGVVVFSKQQYINPSWRYSIQMYDIETSEVTTISTSTTANRWHPEAKAGWVVWPDRRDGQQEEGGDSL